MSGGLYLVTGASRGIGAALARELAAPGRVIGVNFRSSKDAAQGVARDVEAKGAKALLLPADVTSAKEVDALFAGLQEPPSALICNAGVPFRHQRVPETSPEDFEAQWRSLALSSFLCARRAAPLMAKNLSGRIVFVLSSAVEGTPPAYMSAYVSAKYAVLGLAKAVEAEFGEKGVSVRCAFPGMVKTDFIKDFPRPIVEAGAPVSPEKAAADIARLVVA